MSVTCPWLSSQQRPRLAIVTTMLRNLRHSLSRVRAKPPGFTARKRLARAEGKQAQDNEVVDDDDVDGHHDDEDTITIIDDEDTITTIDD